MILTSPIRPPCDDINFRRDMLYARQSMDHVQEIKARLPIDQLVGRYVQLQKKGRNFVGLCPFHQDSHPSFLVSPEKGICYCFPCQKGGDVFAFYQLIEGVDFRQAIKDLAEMAGVEVSDSRTDVLPRDEKDRLRACLTDALQFYRKELESASDVRAYLTERGVDAAEADAWELGYAPARFGALYDHLLKAGYSRSEIVSAGLASQKELEGRTYDRFHHRLMFPIRDGRGDIIGFGGRTMGSEQAKYLNGADSPLYRKSSVLYGLHRALSAMRAARHVVLVEGYFDVLACHRAGVTDAVATCGTALTEEHVRLLCRSADRVTLCLDQDRAGREAAERAYALCTHAGLLVDAVVLPRKDPADVACDSVRELHRLLRETHRPYFSLACDEIRAADMQDPLVRRASLERLLTLVQVMPSASERSFALREAADALGTWATPASLASDLERLRRTVTRPPASPSTAPTVSAPFTRSEIALGLFLLYPRMLSALSELHVPEEPFAQALHMSLTRTESQNSIDLAQLGLTEDDRHRAEILHLYCEEQGMGEWSDAVALREIRSNCRQANREQLLRKQKVITQRLIAARRDGASDEEASLIREYQTLIEQTRSNT